MYIHGSFINEKHQLVTVRIVTCRSLVKEVEIGEFGSPLCFTDDPLEISSEVNDTFDVLLRRSATIRLYSRNYEPEFFQGSARDAVVNIERDGSCLFAGYLEPQTYSQAYNEVYDEIELSCIDGLSVLQYSKYLGVGMNGVSYRSVKSSACDVTFQEVLFGIFGRLGSDLSISGEGLKLFYDGSKCLDSSSSYDIFGRLKISELLFLGDDEDDVWSEESVVEELLKYLNLHIYQDGLVFYIFSWESVKSSNDIAWHSLTDSEEMLTRCARISIGMENVGDCGSRISVGEIFNQLLLTCEVKTVESVIESPLDDSHLLSPYSSMQKYLTEYSSDGEGERAQRGFWDILNDRPTDYEHALTTEWFARVMENAHWQFFIGGELTDHYCEDNLHEEMLLNKLSREPGCAIIGFGKIEKASQSNDNSPVSRVDMTNYLVMSVNGNLDDSALGTYPSESDLKRSIPYARYVGNQSGGVFSPSDDAALNYIVVSGSVILNPVMQVSFPYPEKPAVWVASKSVTVPSRKNEDGRYYTRQYWKSLTPRQSSEYDSSVGVRRVSGDENPTDVDGLLPFTGSGPEEYEYKYSAVGDGSDTVSKVSVIACMLRIGDKVLVEKEKGETLGTGIAGSGSGQVSDFVWLRYKERTSCLSDEEYYRQCFYIGIDPKIGDKLIGTEFGVQNNIDYTMGITAQGMAIPIRKSDKLSGRVEFQILGPVNSLWGEITRRHPSFWRHTSWSTHSIPLLAHVSSIMVKQLELKVYSDNGLHSDMNDGDLVYMSDTVESFLNKKDDLVFKLSSGLTVEECRRLGVSDSVRMSTPTDTELGTGITTIYDANRSVSGKAERLYLDSYYKEYHAARVELEQTLEDEGSGISMFNHYVHPALGKEMFVEGISRDLMGGTARIKMKEIEEWQ